MKTSYDLKQKRNAVELDIQALYETLQEEINEQKDMRDFNFAHIFLLCSVNWNLKPLILKPNYQWIFHLSPILQDDLPIFR